MAKEELIQPEQLKPVAATLKRTLDELDALLLGQQNIHKMVLIGIISRGHILLEGLPGVGKTALVKALGQLLKLDFNRIQFTPDLMPSDILGTNILQEDDKGRKEMIFRHGPVFTNILLADEINRASPKTQAAMLESMQEASVTLLGETRQLPFPFFVLASQNPIEMEGTYPIPEAQLDRFMFKLHVTSVDSRVLNEIISTRRRGTLPAPDWTMNREVLEGIFDIMDKIYLPQAVSSYISRLVAATHPESAEAIQEVKDYVSYGSSPRAAIAIAEASRAAALIDGRPAVGFKDVDDVVPSVLNHRMLLNYKARMDNINSFAVIGKILEQVDEADLDLPEEIKVS
jgi:MoxR-like ATPase